MFGQRRSFFRKALLTAVGFGLSPALAPTVSAAPPIRGKFVHMVFFWLKGDSDVDQFIQGTESFLKKVPEVIDYHLGTPAGTPREVVDNTYTVSLVVTFESKEGQDAYQQHPAHLAYVDDNKSKWTQVKIYDSWSKL